MIQLTVYSLGYPSIKKINADMIYHTTKYIVLLTNNPRYYHSF